LSKVFKEIDADNDGFLSKDEIEEAISKMIGSSKTDFEAILKAADADGDG